MLKHDSLFFHITPFDPPYLTVKVICSYWCLHVFAMFQEFFMGKSVEDKTWICAKGTVDPSSQSFGARSACDSQGFVGLRDFDSCRARID